MLNTRLTASALSARLLLSFAGVVALGAATLMPAHADIKIGFQVPLTGPAATDGKSAQWPARWRWKTSMLPAACSGRSWSWLPMTIRPNRTRRFSPPTS